MFLSLLSLTTGGMLWVTALCPLQQIVWRFVRLIAVLAFLCCTGAVGWFVYCGWHNQGPAALLAAAGSLLAGLASMAVLALAPLMAAERNNRIRLIRLLLMLGGAAAMVGGLGWLTFFDLMPAEPGMAWFVALLGNVLSAFLIGSVCIGWLLGHRYLTASGMTIEPLRAASKLLIIAVGGRWIYLVAVIASLLYWPTAVAPSAHSAQQLLLDWFMLSVRVGVGLVVPTALAYMAWDCVKLRSTQSATGILFFTSVLILIGEFTSHYLGRDIGPPL